MRGHFVDRLLRTVWETRKSKDGYTPVGPHIKYMKCGFSVMLSLLINRFLSVNLPVRIQEKEALIC